MQGLRALAPAMASGPWWPRGPVGTGAARAGEVLPEAASRPGHGSTLGSGQARQWFSSSPSLAGPGCLPPREGQWGAQARSICPAHRAICREGGKGRSAGGGPTAGQAVASVYVAALTAEVDGMRRPGDTSQASSPGPLTLPHPARPSSRGQLWSGGGVRTSRTPIQPSRTPRPSVPAGRCPRHPVLRARGEAAVEPGQAQGAGRTPAWRGPSCALSPQCKKKHTLLCPDFSRGGTCPRGAQCQLLHRSQKCPGRRAAAAPAPEPSSAPPRSRASTGHGPR